LNALEAPSQLFNKTQLLLGFLLTFTVIVQAYGEDSNATSDPGSPTTLVTAVHGQSTEACALGQQCLHNLIRKLTRISSTMSQAKTPWTDSDKNIITISQIPYVEGSNSATYFNPAGSVFEMKVDSASGTRSFKGNGLPSTPMGNFPLQPGTSAYSYYAALPGGSHGGHTYASAGDIGITTYDLSSTVPLNPVATGVYPIRSLILGITLTGAVWHMEVAPDANNKWYDPVNVLPLDQCWGHPYAQQYHHHAYSWKCFPNQGTSGQSPVFGFALDGFPITGPRAADGHMLTNEELDQCHGTTSEITMPDGTLKNTYHYVLNREYPYSIGCFRGKVDYRQALGSDDMRQTGMPVYTIDKAIDNVLEFFENII
jgi:hypothetical protein